MTGRQVVAGAAVATTAIITGIEARAAHDDHLAAQHIIEVDYPQATTVHEMADLSGRVDNLQYRMTIEIAVGTLGAIGCAITIGKAVRL